MKVNIGGADRIFRIVTGLALIGLAITGTIGTWGWIGVLVLTTGIFGFCPAYSLMGVKTFKNE
jgi:hypothetical protein